MSEQSQPSTAFTEQPNTAFPYQPGYQRADRADDYQPSPVAARALSAEGTAVQRAHAAMDHAKREHEKFLDTVKQDRHRYSDQGYAEQLRLFADSDAAKGVDQAVAQVQARRDQAQTRLDKLRRDLSPPGDTAVELRNTRTWERTRRILDTARDGELVGAAQEAISKADRAELGVLLQELPAYLESRGSANDWIDASLGQVVPEYSAAQTELKRAEQAHTIAKHNANKLMRGFSEGRPVTEIVDASKYDPDA